MASSRRVHHGRASASTRRERDPLAPEDSAPERGGSPRRLVYGITSGRRGVTRWLRVGVAFVNRDGSVNVYLDAVPLSGKLQIREESTKPEGEKPSPQDPEPAP